MLIIEVVHPSTPTGIRAFPSPHRHDLLGTRRMYCHASVEILLPRPHLHSNSKSLHHLTYSLSQEMQPNDFLFRSLTNNLELCWLLCPLFCWKYVVKHCGELGMVNFDVLFTVLCDGLWLCQSNSSNFWVSKDDGGNIAVREKGVRKLWRTEEAI